MSNIKLFQSLVNKQIHRRIRDLNRSDNPHFYDRHQEGEKTKETEKMTPLSQDKCKCRKGG